MKARSALQRVRTLARERGFDLAATFRVSTYNAAVEPRLALGARGDEAGLLLGNTAALWEPFVRHVARRRAAGGEGANPLEEYTEETLRQACEEALGGAGVEYDLRFSHRVGPRVVAMQRLAHLSGLARLDHGTMLCVHREAGPWLALRAVVVVLGERADEVLPVPGLDPEDRPPPDPCAAAGCAAEQRRAFELAMAARAGTGAEQWRRWVAVRDACRVGRDHRYPDDQVEYHYTKSREALDRAVARHDAGGDGGGGGK